MPRLSIALLFLAACPSKATQGGACKKPSDCADGLACVAAICQAVQTSGGCAAASDCPEQQACVDGSCGSFGCDSTHTCNDGCCSAGQCVPTNGCAGNVTCGADAVCPLRCDAASNGNGCNDGCCNTSTGACADGTANDACGNAATCLDCGAGATCTAQACTCTNCTGSTVCHGGTCADCGSNPCGGATPFCDSSTTHACQPCTSAAPGFCATATATTPYCNSTGACSATPDSNASCLDFDPGFPVFVAPDQCSCSAQIGCADGLLCDASNPAAPVCAAGCTPNTTTGCFDPINTFCNGGTACVPPLADGQDCDVDLHCANQRCVCYDGSCSKTVCAPSKCGPCAAIDPSHIELGPPGACAYTDVGSQPPDCDGALACSGKGDASANCLTANGYACTSVSTTSTECASGFCNNGAPDDGDSNAHCMATVCPACTYSTTGASCDGFINQGLADACTSGDVCDGNGSCKLPETASCSADGDCATGFCDSTLVGGGGDQCAPFSCPVCSYYTPTGPEGAGCNLQTSGTHCGKSGTCNASGKCA